jgi:23S rRNA (adenine2503-C2)-methyltransferase
MDTHLLPTGYLIVDDYAKGQLETLSIGDYGKSKNIKADFLGYHRDLNGVENGNCMPLSEKWVITLSTQYGCAMKCNFCDVPNIKFAGNASFDDLKRQLYTALAAFPGVKYTDRLNIHYARMGDPIFNEAVFGFSIWLADNKKRLQEETGIRFEVIHPVLTTMLPEMKHTAQRIRDWVEIKNDYFNGQAGMQWSINSTDEKQRAEMFGGKQMSLEDISTLADSLPEPLGRKYCLNIAYSTDFIVDAKKLSGLFDTEKYMVKITPIHNNDACRENGIETVKGYTSYAPYKPLEERLKAEGFDVLVFVPSFLEEDGIVTCGNAILGGSSIKSDVDELKIIGLT